MNNYLINLLMYCTSKHQIKIFLFLSLSLSLSLSFQRKEGRDWNGVKQSLRRSYQRWLNHKIRAPSSNSFGIIPISLGLVSIRVSIYCEEGKLQTGKFVTVKGEGVVVKWKAGEVKKLFIYFIREKKHLYIY